MNAHSKVSVLLVADIHSEDLDTRFVQEWEGRPSVQKIAEVLEESGENVEILESPSKVLQKISEYSALAPEERPVLFHLVEGFLSRNREALLPALAEYFGFPHTGSDAYAQALSLDKHASKLWAQSIGVPTASWGIWERDVVPSTLPKEKSEISHSLDGFLGHRLPMESEFPVFWKPRYEGSSLGIGEENRIADSSSLATFLSTKAKSHSSWIWESYLPGEEWTLAGIGSSEEGYETSSVARIGLERSEESVYGEKTKTKASMPEVLHFDLDPERENRIRRFSEECCRSLGISGAVRLDWKADEKGNPNFLEWNLTPGLSAYYSSYPICYSRSIGTYSELMNRLLKIAREEFRTDRFAYTKLMREAFSLRV